MVFGDMGVVGSAGTPSVRTQALAIHTPCISLTIVRRLSESWMLRTTHRILTRRSIPPKTRMLCTDVFFRALVYGTQLSIHFMRQNKTPGGCIFVTSSQLAVHPHGSFSEYCGAKAAGKGLGKA